jgi:hypothetical protein
MRRLRPSPASFTPRSVFVCLLLTLSFLFNPYLTALGSGGGLNVRHPASHRATVGYSELEKFSPLASQDSLDFVPHFFADALSLLPARTSFFFLPAGREHLPGRGLFRANLWFRPPPAA